jgi:hypothetical protein
LKLSSQKTLNGQGLISVWCPPNDDASVSDYKLHKGEAKGSVTKVSLEGKKEAGVSEALQVVDQTVKINVSERPIIILVDKI